MSCQDNSYSCGVFACSRLEYWLKYRRFPSSEEFNQSHDSNFRLYITKTILKYHEKLLTDERIKGTSKKIQNMICDFSDTDNYCDLSIEDMQLQYALCEQLNSQYSFRYARNTITI